MDTRAVLVVAFLGLYPCLAGAAPDLDHRVRQLQQLALKGPPNEAAKLAAELGGSVGAGAREPIAKLLAHKDRRVRFYGALAIHALDPERAGKELAAQLSLEGTDANGMDFWRTVVIDASRRLKVAATLPPLARLVTSLPAKSDRSLREKAADAIREIGAAPVTATLRPVLDSGRPTPRLFASIALWREEHEAALASLRDQWAKRGKETRRFRGELGFQLARLGDADLLPQYREMLRTGESRAVALVAIGQLKAKEALPEVLLCLDDPDPQVKAVALLTVDAFQDEQAQKDAKALLLTKPFAPAIAQRVRETLARPGFGASKESLDRWIPLLLPRSSGAKGVERIAMAKEACEHWGGEEPYDKARAKEMADGMDRDCNAAVRTAVSQLKQWPNSKEVRAAAEELRDYLKSSLIPIAPLEAALATKK